MAAIYQYFNISSDIFFIFLGKNFIKIHSKRHQIAQFPKKLSREHAPDHQIAQPQHKLNAPPPPLLTNSAQVHMLIVNLSRTQNNSLYVKQSINMSCSLEYKVVCCLLLKYKIQLCRRRQQKNLIDVEAPAMTFPRPF